VVKLMMGGKSKGDRKIRYSWLRLLAASRVYDFRQAYAYNLKLSATLYFHLGYSYDTNRIYIAFNYRAYTY